MDEDVKAARARSFGSVADVYERTRPGYPDDAVRWLVGPAPVDVVDVGAGTGKLTRQLVTLGHRVVAVDPSADMLDQLRAVLPDVRASLGSAESLPLPDASADVVTFAQSWHWVDVPRAAAEMTRVLRPGGRIGLVWNLRDERSPVARRLSTIIGSEDAVLTGGPPTRDPQLPAFFGPFENAQFPFEQRLDRNAFIGLVASRSYVHLLPAAERARVLERVAQAHDEFANDGQVALPYVTRCFRATRR